MSIATFASPALLAPVQQFLRWVTNAGAPAPKKHGYGPSRVLVNRARALPQNKPWQVANPRTPFATKSIAVEQDSASANGQFGIKIEPIKPAMALRIVRVCEAGQKPSNAGRMVISGRMADVCAELDRLVAREATLH